MKATRSEGSVQFSLGELLKLEDERVGDEAREREAREQALITSQADAARREQAEVDAKFRAEVEANERRQRAELDAVAEREALQRAKVEQVRLEVDARTRADERERERRHELELSTVRSVQPKPTGLGALFGATGLGGGLMLAVALVVHFGIHQPTNERRFAELELRAGTAEQHASDAERKLEEQRKQIAALDKGKATLEKTVSDLQAAPTVKPPTRPGGPNRTPAPPPKPVVKEADCDDKIDPMCFGKAR